MSCFTNQIVFDQIHVCVSCQYRVLVFPFPGRGAVVWDPTPVQRRMARSVVSARMERSMPPWNPGAFGAIHTCPAPRVNVEVAARLGSAT